MLSTSSSGGNLCGVLLTRISAKGSQSALIKRKPENPKTKSKKKNSPIKRPIPSPLPPNNINIARLAIISASLSTKETPRKHRQRPGEELRPDPLRAGQEPVHKILVLGIRKPAVSLLKLPVDQDVRDVADVGVQDDGGDGVGPAEQGGAAAVEDDEVGFCARADYAEVWAPQGEPALARGEEEGLVYGHCYLFVSDECVCVLLHHLVFV